VSDRPIQVGDLVQVVRSLPCCHHASKWHGHIYIVSELYPPSPSVVCIHCNSPKNFPTAIAEGHDVGVLVCMLKRIPPLSELESTDQDIKEPA
jgi:hypothetical protein